MEGEMDIAKRWRMRSGPMHQDCVQGRTIYRYPAVCSSLHVMAFDEYTTIVHTLIELYE